MSGREATSLPDSSRSGEKHDASTDEDRISGLPDSIIGEILSFLPTKNAYATGILSKRWKGLWTLAARNLDFSCPKNFTGSTGKFLEFVNYVLFVYQPLSIHRFSLTWEAGCVPFCVDMWINVALHCDVSELFVCASVSNFYVHASGLLPIQVQSSLFSSESLKSLELICNVCISTSDFVFNLPRLERLKLISVYFDNFEDIGEILNGCPVLKYFIIHMDIGKMVEHGYFVVVDDEEEEEGTYGDIVNPDHSEICCVLSSASLIHLEISVNAFNSSPRPLNVSWVAELDLPSLRYIKLDGFLLGIEIQQESLAFLEEANIEINGPLSEETDYCNSLVESFSAFGCAKTLTLHDQVIRALRYAPFKLATTFERLTRLEVAIDCSYWSSLQDFIMLSDNLKVLIVHKYGGLETKDVPHNNNSNEKKVDLVPKCLSKSLQTVSIGGYYGHRDELAMIKYIIKHASILKIMEIGFKKSVSKDLKRKCKLVQVISAFRKKSKTCEVIFLDYVKLNKRL